MVGVVVYAVILGQAPGVVETSIGKLSGRMVEHTFVVSPDNRRVAFVDKREGKECVVVDGVAGKLYDAIPTIPLTEAGRPPSIEFSQDGKRVGYTVKDGDGYRVVVDGEAGPQFKSIAVGAVDFSPDGKRFAYIASDGDADFVVIDGKPSGKFDYVSEGGRVFSLDSQHWLFYGRRGEIEYAVLDGIEMASDVYKPHPSFFENGHSTDVKKVGEKWVVYIDGKPSKAYDSIGNNIEFSADGKHYLFRARDASGTFLVVDGVEGKRWPAIDENSYKFTPDGRTSHVVKIAAESYVVIGDKAEKSYEWVSEPTFSKNGSSMAYVADSKGKRFVVHNGKKGKDYLDIGHYPRFMGPNDTLMYVGKDQQMELNYGDKVFPYLDVDDFRASELGNSLIYSAKTIDGWGAYVDFKLVAKFDDGPPAVVISEDGKHWAACGPTGNQVVVYHDGKEVQKFDTLQSLVLRESDGRLISVGQEGAKVTLNGVEGGTRTYDRLMSMPYLDTNGVLWLVVQRSGEFFSVKVG